TACDGTAVRGRARFGGAPCDARRVPDARPTFCHDRIRVLSTERRPGGRRYPQWWCHSVCGRCRVVVLPCGRVQPQRRRIAVRRATTLDKFGERTGHRPPVAAS